MIRWTPIPTTIETERLTLRPVRQDDRDDIVAGVSDGAVARMLAKVPFPYDPGMADAWIADTRSRVRGGKIIVFAVARSDRLIGVASIGALPYRCVLGYWLARPCWGQGYATEAVQALLRHAFAERRLRLVRSGVFVDNPASLRVQLKLGFRRVGLSARHSLARKASVAHIDTLLIRERFRVLP